MMVQQKEGHSYKVGGMLQCTCQTQDPAAHSQLLTAGCITGICLSPVEVALTKAVALLGEPVHLRVGLRRARAPRPGWEQSTGPLQLQKLPAGLPRASVTIVLGFGSLLSPPLLFVPLTGAVLVSVPQKAFHGAAHTCIPERPGLGNRYRESVLS